MDAGTQGPVASIAMTKREREQRIRELERKMRRQRERVRRAQAEDRYYNKGGRPPAGTRGSDGQSDLLNRPKSGPPRPGVPEGEYGRPDAKSAAVRPGPRLRPPLTRAGSGRQNTAPAGSLGRVPAPAARQSSFAAALAGEPQKVRRPARTASSGVTSLDEFIDGRQRQQLTRGEPASRVVQRRPSRDGYTELVETTYDGPPQRPSRGVDPQQLQEVLRRLSGGDARQARRRRPSIGLRMPTEVFGLRR